MNIIIVIMVSTLVSALISCVAVLSYIKKLNKLFDKIMEEHRNDIKDVTIKTINEWLGSRGK